MSRVQVTERDFQEQVLELARLYGWRVAHFRPAQTRHGWRTAVAADGAGWPDLVLVRDRVLYRECKVGGNRLSDEQEAWARALIDAQADVGIWRPEYLEEIARELGGNSGGGRGVLAHTLLLRELVEADVKRRKEAAA